MNDFDTRLTALLDDAAATIDPTPDFDAVTARPVVAAGGRARFPRAIGIAAVSVALLGGSVAAFELAESEPDTLVTSSAPADGPDDPMPKPTTPVDEPDPTETVPGDKEPDDRPAQPKPDDEHDGVERTAEFFDLYDPEEPMWEFMRKLKAG